MIIKKSDIYSSIWQSCDELRGGMDASQYKDYVLFMLFIKYITDKYGNSTDFAPPVTIPKGASFTEMLDLRGKSDIGDRINTQVIAPLVQANTRLARSDFPDFNDPNKLGEGNEMVERLTNLISIFARPELDFSRNRADHDDMLGDAYEYLMRHFATESGKSKGQFYTPAEVSRVIAQVIGISPQNTKASTTAYDPTCGSGSLLLKVAAQADKQITLEGQDKDGTTAGLARMNMILHDFPTANIVSGNTLTTPRFKEGEQLRTYDYVVANPPFSDKTWTTGLTPSADLFQRFAWGEPPAKQGDYAYLLHIIRSMKRLGKAACVLPHGVLFRGGAEAAIREQLVRSGYLKGIIGLPPNLFYGTGIPACIVVLDKENAAGRGGIFMIDGSKEFRKEGPKNRLREQDIHRIVHTFARQVDVSRYARMVSIDEIADPRNDFNLNLPRYIDSTESEDSHDMDGHLRGGIPECDVNALEAYWQVFPSVRSFLFKSAGRPGYVRPKPALTEVKRGILEHPEFCAFQQEIEKVFADWCSANTPCLTGFGKDGHPKPLIEAIAEDLLTRFRQAPLLASYDIYQHLMDYWADSMQDDAYLIAAEGWVKGAQPREIVRVKDKNNKLTWPEPHDYLKGKRRFKSDLVPASILVARYFVAERDGIHALDNRLVTLEQKLNETREENGGDDGLLVEVIDGEGDKQKITAKAVKARLKEIGADFLFADERRALERYADLLKQQSDVKSKRDAAQRDLDQKIDALYPKLTKSEIKTLVVDDKWIAHLSDCAQSEIDRVSQMLTGRIRQLAERYATPLTELYDEVEGLTARVEEHLEKMGAVWN
ncbi:MAG: N-6 DNA methylase [Candidatus Tectomicrobia bacterium]|nr:N-6 DNA methylase [Candidatus Tectomicrobia bacterium]